MPAESCRVAATSIKKNESHFHYTQIIDGINMNPRGFGRSSSCNRL